MEIPAGRCVEEQLLAVLDAVGEYRADHHHQAAIVGRLVVPDELLPLVPSCLLGEKERRPPGAYRAR